jgi:parallel beta-helix repeat protein
MVEKMLKKNGKNICRGRALGIAFGITIVVLLLAGGASAITPVVGTLPAAVSTTINNGPGNQADPHIDGDLVSYTSAENGVSQIRYYNFTTALDQGIPTIGGSLDFLSDVSGSMIVFTRIEGSNQNHSVWSFDTATFGPAVELMPAPTRLRRGAAIGGMTVAWQEFGFAAPTAFISELAAYDITTATMTRITDDTFIDRDPAVASNGNVIVWDKCATSSSPCDIWQAVKGSAGWTTTQVTNTPDHEYFPDTNGIFVVYGGLRTGSATSRHIYWKPIAGGEERQLELVGEQHNPNIAGNFIVFEGRNLDDPSPNWDIYLYDMETNILYQLTNSPSINETLNGVSISPDGMVHVVWNVVELDQNVYGLTFQLPQRSIAACGTISSPGVYVLNTNLASSTTCIRITSSDVILDGAGHWINGTGIYGTYGVYANKSSIELTNVTVKNLNVTNWSNGIYYHNVDNGSILNSTASNSPNGYGILLWDSGNSTISSNTASNNKWAGIYLISSDTSNVTGNNASNNIVGIDLSYSGSSTVSSNTALNNTNAGISLSNSGNSRISGNTLSNNSWYGIYLIYSSNDIIYNNSFNNTNNFHVYNEYNLINTWNITQISGINIIGGPQLGGNFWASPSGTGFSQTCRDLDRNEICDSIYTLDSNNVDYLPLAVKDIISPTTTVTLSGTLGNSGWYVSNVGLTLIASDNPGGLGVYETEHSFDGTNWDSNNPFTISGEGTTNVYYKSTDNAGNVESTKIQTIKIDNSLPIISFSGLDTINLGAMASTTVSVTDSGSGVASQSPPGSTIPLDTASMGTKSLTVTARDNAGNEASSTFSYKVIYDFAGAGGFQSPISSTATNTGKAGSVVPVKWQLPDGSGGFISDLKVVLPFTYRLGSCSSSTSEFPADTSGNTGLRYDTTTNQYIYNWKTPNIAGCYMLVLKLNDDSEYTANFALR